MAPDPDETASLPQQEADRRQKLTRLRDELGVDPYGGRIDGLLTVEAARRLYDPETDRAQQAGGEDARPHLRVAGRAVLHRDIGRLVFLTLRDGTGDIQVAVSKKAVSAEAMKLAKLADLGDIVAAEGRLGTTKTGEITVWANADDPDPDGPLGGGFRIATKSLAPPPEKWQGLQDPEQRYRRRYVDLYANPEVMRVFRTRSRVLKRIRDFLAEPPASFAPGYWEVETPMMQSVPGGAAARPFVTHHNALEMDLFLRVAPELHLKRLLVGGMPRVFEINRNFRNEGISPRHNPEFTMLELYQAFGDYGTMMELTEALVRDAARLAARDADGDAAALPWSGHTIDYESAFARASYHELFERVNGFPASDTDRVLELARRHHVPEPDRKDPDLLLQAVWEETVEKTLVQPTFVYDYPASLCPLTRSRRDDPAIAERFELYVAGLEIANAYTELNDPDVQARKFAEQLAGVDEDEAVFRTKDEDFLDALKVGMPPAGGLGVGIDRLMMLLTNQRSIRDVILFPLMRPTDRGEGRGTTDEHG